MSMIEHIDSVKEYISLNFPNLSKYANNYYSACLLHVLISYYKYLCSPDRHSLYLNEKEEMLKRACSASEIESYFLISERGMNLNDMVSKIQMKIKR